LEGDRLSKKTRPSRKGARDVVDDHDLDRANLVACRTTITTVTSGSANPVP
jgi:hypothetical protein